MPQKRDAGKLVPFQSGDEVVLAVEAVINPGHIPGSTF
jgi:hypothetical protein